MRPRRSTGVAQAWVEIMAEDPEAFSAFAVARARLVPGQQLIGLRKVRLLELTGALPDHAGLEDLLHRSSQFYNPHKERCTVRGGTDHPAPLLEGEVLVLVTERSGERRGAAERWWCGQTGQRVEVREGIVWALRFAPGVRGLECAAELATVRDLRHGLLCNPHSQEVSVTEAPVPFPWITARSRATRIGN